MANWSQCEEFPKRKLRKGETVRNRNTSTETNKTSKHRSPQISPSQLPSRALRIKTVLPELRLPPKKPPQQRKKEISTSLEIRCSVCYCQHLSGGRSREEEREEGVPASQKNKWCPLAVANGQGR
ncbi:hypothetical protein TNCV_2397761 [Trichonephila clavipes]|uniref:Uncharacterized protein n=1 Tax=Trichonephila clavipes TaxID=2585209 RepID=A0A8X6SS65_TRICX|nr:hypothetical protein TNCV_2397761 [Trichonephila clavipes]